MSARVSTSSALNRACSGAMYSGVPATLPKAVNRLCSVSRIPLVALARPKSITLGTGLSSWASTRMLEGLRSRWMIPFWCGVLHGRADLAEERQPGVEVEAVGVAVLGDRDPFHQLHDEERAAVGGRAGIEDAGDIGVLHQRQGLALGLEPGQDIPRVHPPLDQLQRHLAADRPELLGEEDCAHPPLADLLSKLVALGDDRIDEVRTVVVRSADGEVVVRRGSRSRRGDGSGGVGPIGGLGIGGERPIQGAGRLVVGGEQGIEPVA